MGVAAHPTVKARIACAVSRPDEGAALVNICLAVNSVITWRTLADELVWLDLTGTNAMCCSLKDSAVVVMAHAFAVLARVQQVSKRGVRRDANDSLILNVCAIFVLKINVW